MFDITLLINFATLVATGDSTNLVIPAVAAGAGVGVIAVALIARHRSKDDDKPNRRPVRTATPRNKHMK